MSRLRLCLSNLFKFCSWNRTKCLHESCIQFACTGPKVSVGFILQLGTCVTEAFCEGSTGVRKMSRDGKQSSFHLKQRVSALSACSWNAILRRCSECSKYFMKLKTRENLIACGRDVQNHPHNWDIHHVELGKFELQSDFSWVKLGCIRNSTRGTFTALVRSPCFAVILNQFGYETPDGMAALLTQALVVSLVCYCTGRSKNAVLSHHSRVHSTDMQLF